MTLDQATIDRYQSGGDIYQDLLSQYGQTAADAVAAAAQTGDRQNITDALVTAKYGANLDTSTFDIFAQQILTDPLAAPLASANNLLNNSLLDFLRSPTVLVVIGVAAFFALGGIKYLKIK